MSKKNKGENMNVEEAKNKLGKIQAERQKIFEDVCHTEKYREINIKPDGLTEEEEKLKKLCDSMTLEMNVLFKQIELAEIYPTFQKKEIKAERILYLEDCLKKIKELKQKIVWN